MDNTHFLSCALAGFTYYHGIKVFKNLEIGTELTLKAEPTNQYDKNAVAVYYEKFKIGYIPRENNQLMSKILLSGQDIFDTYIQVLRPHSHPEGQVSIVVHVKKGSDEK